MVDQHPTKDAAKNFGIRPLPNLESKFVTANTLIPLDRSADLFSTSADALYYEDLLKELNHRIFATKKSSEKERLREAIHSTRIKYAQTMQNLGFIGTEGYNQLMAWDMFNQNASSPFFDPEWMFGIKDGFDIVIGNPPYIRRTSLPEQDKIQYERIYQSADRQYDLYLLFIEKGLKSLISGGFLCYINPIRFFNADYGEQCRTFIAQSHSVKKVLDVSQLSVFENASTYPCVLLIENNKAKETDVEYISPALLSDVLSIGNVESIYFSQSYFEGKNYLFVIPKNMPVQNLINKIDTITTKISSFFDVARGLANNKVDFNGDCYKALKSKSVRRYSIIGEEVDIDTELAEKFVDEMVIMPRTVSYLQAMLKRKGLVLLDRIYYLIPLSTEIPSLKYVLALFNSKLTNFWFNYYYESTKVRGGYFDLNGNQIKSIPLVVPFDSVSKKICSLVDKIIEGKKFDYLSLVPEEQEIDHIVYHLYNLTYDEVLIIDPQTPITREEYEAYK